MSESKLPSLTIRSHRGTYTVEFGEVPFRGLESVPFEGRHFIVDARVAGLYSPQLAKILAAPSVLRIDATEKSKSLERCPEYVEHLVARGVRRDHKLIAIGGGIIQDITAFLASTLLRGIGWEFHPTTLLAQADSCIGSKSSINVGSTKNIVGTFCPPASIYISTAVQGTLDDADVRSGIGEMLKAHAIDGPQSFDRIASDYPKLFSDASTMQAYIRRSLEIKLPMVETDEFDRGARLVMNYGHSFGHAIEAATEFAVPHGIAVTLGMDMANFVSTRLGRLSKERFRAMHAVLNRNARGFTETPVPLDDFSRAIGRDKKNRADRLTLILPDRAARMEKLEIPNDAGFRELCAEYLSSVRMS